MLSLLPDLTFPITPSSVNGLMDGVVQLNLLDAGLNEKQQRGLTLYLHTHDLWVKSKGRLDYRGEKGHALLVQHALNFVGHGNPVATRHGDLAGAHLAIDFHDAQTRLRDGGFPLLSHDVNELLRESRDLCEHAIEIEKRIGLLMDYLGKRPL